MLLYFKNENKKLLLPIYSPTFFFFPPLVQAYLYLSPIQCLLGLMTEMPCIISTANFMMLVASCLYSLVIVL